jgi:hypothetical protein
MKTRILSVCTLAALLALVAVPGANAQPIPQLVSFQGRLTAADGEPLPSGTYGVTFELFSSPDPAVLDPVWGATYTVVVISGQFNVILGAAGGTPVPEAEVSDLGAAFAVGDKFLQMTVLTDGEGNDLPTPQILLPRQQILSTPYALTAANVTDATITTAKLSDGAVTTAKLDGGAVTAAKFGSDVGVWARSGQHISYTAGPVGIGTTSPGVPLTIEANARTLRLQSDRQGGHNFIEYYTDSPSASRSAWVGFGTDGTPHFTIDNAKSGGNIRLIPGSGGTVQAGTFTATGSGAGAQGRYGNDNSIVAWARVNANGSVQRSVGMGSPAVTRLGTGRYAVSIASGMTASTTLIPTVTPLGADPRFATVETSSTTGFTVRIWRPLSTGAGLVDTPFVVIVTGR